MKGLWCVVGKACLDKAFAQDLRNIVGGEFFGRRRDGQTAEVDERLHDFFFFEHGFMLSRWERGEVARLFDGRFAAFESVLTTVAGFVVPESASENYYAFVGACCLDNNLLLKVAELNDKFDRDFSVTLSGFRLSDNEIRSLRSLLKKPFTEALTAADREFWTRPGEKSYTTCIWSFTHDPAYRHLAPEALNRAWKNEEDLLLRGGQRPSNPTP